MRENKIRQQLTAWAQREFADAATILVQRGQSGMWDVTVEWPEDGIIEIHSFSVDGEGLRFLGVTEIEEA